MVSTLPQVRVAPVEAQRGFAISCSAPLHDDDPADTSWRID